MSQTTWTTTETVTRQAVLCEVCQQRGVNLLTAADEDLIEVPGWFVLSQWGPVPGGKVALYVDLCSQACLQCYVLERHQPEAGGS